MKLQIYTVTDKDIPKSDWQLLRKKTVYKPLRRYFRDEEVKHITVTKDDEGGFCVSVAYTERNNER